MFLFQIQAQAKDKWVYVKDIGGQKVCNFEISLM